MNNIIKLKPFQKFCMTIGNLPSSYVESLTYLELLYWLCNYLEKEVVPVVNNNSEVVAELQNFISNYFDNLNVQEEINNKLDEITNNGTLLNIFAQYLKSHCVSHYGGIEGQNLTPIINSMINDYGITHIYCDISGELETITIQDSQNVTIDFMNNVIEFKNKYAEYNLFDNSGTLTLKNGIFNGNNNNSCTVLRGRNLSHNFIDNCKFLNFKESDNTRQTHVIFVYNGSYSKITNCHFENIKQVGNGTIGDYGGAASCILSQYDSENPTTNETSLIVDNCSFKNNWNINAQNEVIEEDFDNIKLQNAIQQGSDFNDKNMFIISNITSYNSGKRVIKAQTNNVSIDNINCVAHNFRMLSVISCFYKNYNISNIYGKAKNMSYVIDFLTVENVNVSDINFTNTDDEITDSIFKAGLTLTGAKNCNFENINISGFSNGISIWDVVDSLNFNNCNFSSVAKSIYIFTRTTQSANPSSGITIKNINFANCEFITSGETTDTIFTINANNDNNYLDNINFINCFFKTLKTTYLYGTMTNNALNSKYQNCYFDIYNDNDNIYNIVSRKGFIKMCCCDFVNHNNTPYIFANGTSKIYLDKIKTNSKLRVNTDAKLLAQYCDYTEIVGNTETNTHIDVF